MKEISIILFIIFIIVNLSNIGNEFKNLKYGLKLNKNKIIKKFKETALFFFAVTALILSISFYYNNSSNESLPTTKLTNTILPVKSKEPIFNEPAIEKPENGYMTNFTNKENIAPFSITTPPGEHYYYILLKNANTEETEVSIFVHPNSTIKTEVPLGRYKISYANGKEWYGTENYFGPNTSYSKSSNILEFYTNYNQIMGHTIRLIKQADGNMHTRPINKAEFNR